MKPAVGNENLKVESIMWYLIMLNFATVSMNSVLGLGIVLKKNLLVNSVPTIGSQ